MKKILSLLTAVSISLSCGSCSLKPENKMSEAILEYYNNDDFYYSYSTSHYTFRLPEYWKSKFISEKQDNCENFYEINSYEENESGLLFSVYEYSDKSYKKELEDYVYLAYDKYYKLHYVMTIPKTPFYPESCKEEYENLFGALSIIRSTFKPFIEVS